MATRKKALVPPLKHVPLKGGHRELLPKSRSIGAVNAAEIAAITVRTRARSNLADLERKVHRLYARSLKQRRYLTHDELAALHGARPRDLDAVEAYAQHHNLVITRRSAPQRSITLTGTLGDLMSAFPSNLRMYHHSTGTYRGQEGAVHIPAQFEGIITGVFGFDTRPRHKSPKRHRAPRAAAGGGKGVAASEFARRYDFPSSHNGASLDGTGQCLAIIELGGGFDANDLKVFFKKIKAPLPIVVAVSVDGAHNHPTPGGGADGEVLLDIEVAGAVVPKATIAVYFATNTDKGLMDATNAAIHDAERKPGVVSISWGSSEDPSDAQSNQAIARFLSKRPRSGSPSARPPATTAARTWPVATGTARSTSAIRPSTPMYWPVAERGLTTPASTWCGTTELHSTRNFQAVAAGPAAAVSASCSRPLPTRARPGRQNRW